LYEICLQRFFPFIAIPALEDSVNVVPFIASSHKANFKNLKSCWVESYVNVFRILAKSTPVVKGMLKE